MVALHNRKLLARDIWPSNIWNDQDWLKLTSQLIDEIAADGITGVAARFELSRRTDAYLEQFGPGGLGRQQAVMAQIYPTQRSTGMFTVDEMQAILDRFGMANDDVGQSIAVKVREKLTSLGYSGITESTTEGDHS